LGGEARVSRKGKEETKLNGTPQAELKKAVVSLDLLGTFSKFVGGKPEKGNDKKLQTQMRSRADVRIYAEHIYCYVLMSRGTKRGRSERQQRHEM